ncbi:hypothetical protein [Endozoicomonas sp. 2B-B]
MKKPLSLALLLLMLSLSVICQARSLKGSFVVEFEQSGVYPGESFSIESGEHGLSDKPSYGVDADSGSNLPTDNEAFSLGGYGVKTSFIESISWQLIYATNLLVAYELVLTTNGTPDSKPYSRLTAEALAAVGALLKSCWNADSPFYKSLGQLEATQGDPFAVTTMMLPGHSQQQKAPSAEASSSSQQASGTATPQAFSSFWSSGSGGGNEGPGQPQHTLGLNCFVDSCAGVCKLPQIIDISEPADWSLGPLENSTTHTCYDHEMAETQPFEQPHTFKFTFTMDDPTNSCTLHPEAIFTGDAWGADDYDPVTCGCGVVCMNHEALLKHQKREHNTGRSEQSQNFKRRR